MSRSKPAPDIDLFARVMRDTKPLRKTAKVARPLESVARAPAAPVTIPAGRAPQAVPNPGIDRRTAQRLRRGQMEIARRLDLHGMTQADAHAALDRAVRQAWSDGARTLLVITGKGRDGRGAIKQNMPRWLAAGDNAAHVLRVEPAQPKDGGAGAYYVLLRRRRAP